MNRLILLISVFFIAFTLFTCNPKNGNGTMNYTADNPNIKYYGRIDYSNPAKPRLSGPGSYFKFRFRGPSCEVFLRDEHLYGQYNYIAIELDGEYISRIPLDSTKKKYKVASGLDDEIHSMLICKATEAGIGYMEFSGVHCAELLAPVSTTERTIEYIGNSITCGMGLDTSVIPCDSGQWFDQHNAYLAYGPITARLLNAGWLLSSVSGIGMSRFWNTDEPTMPEVYDNLYLNADTTKKWNTENFNPDMVSICLGQNDFSDGEGPKPRAALDSSGFTDDYIGFLKKLRVRYPEAKICCISSPMIDGKKKKKLFSYLNAISDFMKKNENANIYVFQFERTYNNGCDWHPSREDHLSIAAELMPFYRRILKL